MKLITHLWKGTDLPSYSNDAYGPRDVLNLWRNARRFVSDLELIVFVDDFYLHELVADVGPEGKHRVSKEEFEALATTTRILRYRGHGIGGWSNRMETFDGNRVPLARDERAVMVDLDTVFVRNADWLWKWDLAPLGLPMDPYSKTVPGSGVVSFSDLGKTIAWDEYRRAKDRKPFPYIYANVPSEMALFRQLWLDHGWPFLEDGMEKLRSLKATPGLAEGGPIPEGTDVVYLHGKPKFGDLDPEHPVRKIWEGKN